MTVNVMERAAFAPEALPRSLKLRRTAVALAEAGRRASPKLDRILNERRREALPERVGDVTDFMGEV
jgi:hypothetical protein